MGELRRAYIESQGRLWNVREFGDRFGWSGEEVSRILTLLLGFPGWSTPEFAQESGFVLRFVVMESILDAELPHWEDGGAPAEVDEEGATEPRIEAIEISRYRPFSGFSASLKQLTVILGANAAAR